ncbi:lipopolysaccharide biosynthesis protein [Aestuariivirga litoralis]|uniref:lipopolysaccharide biosynthesis protein n=1 Tax=Aestuariivirga litoralis TaxID=2650924 RepID=UPI0018C4C2B3|nr:oligosaccharide flippase family protein [Aestuariivirga litoralis]MBG1233233.1 oligosaccharide flippase family protein [Aestuariivirga litoralis]
MLRDLINSTIQLLRLLVIRAGGLLFLFLANVIISRSFGVDVLGQFQYCLALVMILSTVGRLGQDQFLLRAAAQAKAQGDANSITVKLASSLTALALPLAAATLALIAWLLVMQPAAPGRVAMQIVMALTILPLGILMVTSETMRGAQRVEASMFLQSFLPQALFLAALYALVQWGGVRSAWIGAAYAASFAASVLATFAFWPTLAHAKSGGVFRATQQAWADGRHFWLAACLNAGTAWIDILVLGLIAGATDVGIYAAIIRTGALIGTFIMLVANPAVPKLAMLYAQKDMKRFISTFITYQALFAASAIPIAALFLIWPQNVLKIWGGEVTSASTAFMIYAAFQILQLFLALPGQLIAVMGLERELSRINGVAFVLKGLLLVAGYSLAGLEGAALGAGLSLLIGNLLCAGSFIRQLLRDGAFGSKAIELPHARKV